MFDGYRGNFERQGPSLCKLFLVQRVVVSFLKLPLLDFEASTDEKTIEDFVQLNLVVGLSVMYVAVNVSSPAIIGFVGVARKSDDGPWLALGFLLVFVGKSFVEGIDDTAKRLEENGEF